MNPPCTPHSTAFLLTTKMGILGWSVISENPVFRNPVFYPFISFWKCTNSPQKQLAYDEQEHVLGQLVNWVQFASY